MSEILETLPLPASLDVYALQGDHPGLQMTEDEPPKTRLNGHSVNHEQRGPIPRWAEQNRTHHESERRIYADRSIEVCARESDGEFGDGTLAKRVSDGSRAEQRQEAKVKEDSQDQDGAECEPSPPGPRTHRWHRPTRFRLKMRRLGRRGVRHEVQRSRGHAKGQTRAREGSLLIMRPQVDEGGNENILLVEDEDMVREVAGNTLREAGYTVLEARNGEEATEICLESIERIHLLDTDIIVPGINGREVSELATSAHPDIAVLFISGYTDDVILQHGVLEANVPSLEKPFTPNRLRMKVRETLASWGAPIRTKGCRLQGISGIDPLAPLQWEIY